jgi:tRNA pseudouridine55 synthase
MHGILLLDKPSGMSSHDVVARVRKVLGTREVGHGGTLDPNATGLLVVAVGQATRWLPWLLDGKRYAATLRLGLATDSEDIWGAERARDELPPPAPEAFRAALESLENLREQVPPMVSAVRKEGRRLYELARAGLEVERAARPVRIHAVRVVAIRGQEADFEVDCSAGTYVRTLCVEVGRRLGRPACLTALRRLGHGAFGLEQALPEARWTRESFLSALLQADAALAHLPAHALDAEQAEAVRHGRAIRPARRPAPGAWRLQRGGQLLALAESVDGLLRPRRVFNAAEGRLEA